MYDFQRCILISVCIRLTEELDCIQLHGDSDNLVDHLCKDTSHTPDIHTRGIVCRAQQDFRGTIPKRHNLQIARISADLSNAHVSPKGWHGRLFVKGLLLQLFCTLVVLLMVLVLL